MRVLIAEDERITRASLTRQLESWGHSVVAAKDGREAWSLFEQEQFDIVLTDWEMPELSGVELIQRIRDLDRPEYVYTIVLTSRSDKTDIVSGIEAGANDFISKPFDREELRVRLLAGERIVSLERRLSKQNEELREAGERMRADLEAAASVQRAMLPKAGLVRGRVRASFEYVPTDELAGDGLGFHLIEDRHLVAYVADVTGHGVPAALLAVNAMHALSPGAGALIADAKSGPSPSAALDALNRRFCGDSSSGRFLTMILCVLDVQTGLLRFARAGHPLPVVARRGHAVTVSEDGGLPLGITDDAEFPDVVLQLEPGDRVYLYSDGCAEQLAASGRQQFGDERVGALLAGSESLTGAESIARLVRELALWAGADRFTDDVSLLVLEWHPADKAKGESE